MVEIKIDNSPNFTLSDTCWIIFSVPYTFSPTFSGKEYSRDYTLSYEVVSASFPNSLWRFPQCINGVMYVKKNIFLLVSINHTSHPDCFYFHVHCIFILIYTDGIVPPICLQWASFMYFHIFLCVSFSSEPAVLSILSYFRHFSPIIIGGKGSHVTLFHHISIRFLPRYHRYHIIYVILQGMLILDDIYLTFLPTN